MFKIYDSNRTNFKVLDSIVLPSGEKAPCICGQIGQCDVVSQNGYYYKRDFWGKVLSNPAVQDQVNNKEMRGMIEHPEDDDEFLCTPYDKASHIVTKVWEENGNPFGVFVLLNNPNGNAIKALIDVGAAVGVSTRGMGNFGHDQKGQYVDDVDYLLLTFDIVARPNFSSLRMAPVTDSIKANPIFKELCEMHQLKDSTYQNYSKESLAADMDSAIQALIKVKEGLLRV